MKKRTCISIGKKMGKAYEWKVHSRENSNDSKNWKGCKISFIREMLLIF